VLALIGILAWAAGAPGLLILAALAVLPVLLYYCNVAPGPRKTESAHPDPVGDTMSWLRVVGGIFVAMLSGFLAFGIVCTAGTVLGINLEWDSPVWVWIFSLICGVLVGGYVLLVLVWVDGPRDKR
jgi:hypothetical protein